MFGMVETLNHHRSIKICASRLKHLRNCLWQSPLFNLLSNSYLIGNYLKLASISWWAMFSLSISPVHIFLSVFLTTGTESDIVDEYEMGPATKHFLMWFKLNRTQFHNKQ